MRNVINLNVKVNFVPNWLFALRFHIFATFYASFDNTAVLVIGKPQLEILCSDAIYQYTYGSDKSRQMRLIIIIFYQIYTFFSI